MGVDIVEEGVDGLVVMSFFTLVERNRSFVLVG